MVNGNGRIPLAEAQKLIEAHHLSQVIIIATTQCGTQVCVAEGLTSRDRENVLIAAEVWNKIVSLKDSGRLAKILRQIQKL